MVLEGYLPFMTMCITNVMVVPWRCGRGRRALASRGRTEDDRLARRHLEDDEGEEDL